MKKIFLVVVIVLGLGWAVLAPVSPTSSAVQLPDALKIAIGGLLLAAVTLGLQAVFDIFHLDLRGEGAAIAAVVSGFAIAQLQGLIDIIPAQYDQVTTIVLSVLVVILSGFGVLRAVFQRSRASALLADSA